MVYGNTVLLLSCKYTYVKLTDKNENEPIVHVSFDFIVLVARFLKLGLCLDENSLRTFHKLIEFRKEGECVCLCSIEASHLSYIKFTDDFLSLLTLAQLLQGGGDYLF